MNAHRLLALAASALLLSGCSTLFAPPYSPDYEALDRLKAGKPGKVAVAPVQPRDANAPVNRITLRGARMAASQGTFAQYLEEALVRDLREISVFDPEAATRLDATILKNDIDVSGLVTGVGTMQVQITVMRAGLTRMKKVYAAETRFDSSFAGMVAIPKGQSEYSRLVRALLREVYADPEFNLALQN